MKIVRLDVDETQNKPIIIPQYVGKLRIYRSQFDPDRLVATYNHESWDFNKFDIRTGIDIITGVVTISELKEKNKNKSNSVIKKKIRKLIKKMIRGLKSLLNYFN